MRRAAAIVVSAAVAAAIPVVLVLDGVRLLANDRYVRFEYGRSWLPEDRYGLTRAQRTELSLLGLRSIQPQHEEGISLLRTARLPDGSPAFGARELRHMADVRTLVRRAYRLQLLSLAGLAILAAALAFSRRTGWIVPRGLRWGSFLAQAIALVLVPLMLVSFGAFFDSWHRVFFKGTTWRFDDHDTLLRLYPSTFWRDTALIVAAATVLQAAVLWGVSSLWLRQAKRRRGRTDNR